VYAIHLAPGVRGITMEDINLFIEDKTIDILKIIQMVQTDSHGAIDTFIGTVRNNHLGKAVTGITYDVHPGITQKIFKEVCQESQALWPETKYAISHFKGELAVGGVSIVIAVSAPHRAESFEACRYVIEEIKKRAPVWKQEHYTEGKSAWLPGHSLNSPSKYNQIDSCIALARRHG
jgi:molybdopterin synthase catalytic subunit